MAVKALRVGIRMIRVHLVQESRMRLKRGKRSESMLATERDEVTTPK